MRDSKLGAASVLNERAREVLRHIVESYVETGAPVGSRTLVRKTGLALSPATIRNVMADLEDAGLLQALHTSGGRLPTEAGLRLFVDAILQVGDLSADERSGIEARCAVANRSFAQVLDEATTMLSGLAECASVVAAPATEAPLRHIEFVGLGPGRALVVLVTADGQVENRLIDMPIGLPAASLIEATNYLNARLVGRSLGEAMRAVHQELEQHSAELDALTAKVVETGLASWGGDGGTLIVRGQARLLADVTAIADLERIRSLFQVLETKKAMLSLMDAASQAEGVQIFIGAQNELFDLAGCSMIVAPFRNGRDQVVGAIGVVGPTRINYARIIPVVDYTAKVITRLIR